MPPHPLFTEALLEQAWQRADWQAQGIADLTVKYASSSGGVDTYNTTSPYNGTATYQMRVLTPTAPNPDYPHAFLLMLPVEQNQDTGTYGDPIGVAQAIAAHNGWNLTCVQPGYAPIGAFDGPWYADNPLTQATWQETFTLLVTAWIRQNLAVTGAGQVYLAGFSRSGLGAQNLLFRHPYMYAGGRVVGHAVRHVRLRRHRPHPRLPGRRPLARRVRHVGQLHHEVPAVPRPPGRLGGHRPVRLNRIWLGLGAVSTPDFSGMTGS